MLKDRLKQLRQERNLTQIEVAKNCNITERSYQRLEAGYKPNHDNLISLADFFDISIDYLLGRSDDPTRY